MQCVRMGKRGEKWNTYGNVFMQRGWMALMLNKTHKGGPVYRFSDRGRNSKFPVSFPCFTGSTQFIKLLFLNNREF